MTETNGFAPEFLESLKRLIEQNDELAAHTQELPKIAQELALLRSDLVSAIVNRMPEGSIPLSTHKDLLREQAEFVKGHNRWWAIMLGVALGIVQIGAVVDKVTQKTVSDAAFAEQQAAQVANYYKDEKKAVAPTLVVK